MRKAHWLATVLSAGVVAVSLGTAAGAQAATSAASGPGAATAAASCQPSDGTQPPAPPSNDSDVLNGVAVVSACDVWAVGTRRVDVSGNDAFQTLVEHWTGGPSWTIVPSPDPGGANAEAELLAVSAASASSVWAVGLYQDSGIKHPVMLHWDGASWTQLTIPGNFVLEGVSALSASDAWAVGDAGGATAILHWDGTSWAQVPSPSPAGAQTVDLASVTATSASNAWAVGSSDGHPLILHWDGMSWTQVPSPDPGTRATLGGVTAVSATDAWAVGSTGILGATLTMHWDGTSWTIIPSPDPGTLIDEVSSVAAASASSVWAVGQYTTSTTASGSAGLLLHWDGTGWTQIPTPSTFDFMNGVATSPGGTIWTAGGAVGPTGLNLASADTFGVVPNVIGDAQVTAGNAVQAAGLGVSFTAVGTIGGGCSNSTAGSVFATDPVAGTIAAPPVNLKVCDIPNVPDLSGDTTGEASAALQAAGLVLGTVRTTLDPACVSINRVTSQDPAAGGTAAPGSPVAIWIGRKNPSHPCPPA